MVPKATKIDLASWVSLNVIFLLIKTITDMHRGKTNKKYDNIINTDLLGTDCFGNTLVYKF